MADRVEFAAPAWCLHLTRWLAKVGQVAALSLAVAGSPVAWAQTSERHIVQLNHLYITLSDVMGASKKGDAEGASALLARLQADFSQIESRNSEKGRLVAKSLGQAMEQPASQQLAALSNALLAFEREQNPVDYSAKRAEFKRKISPAYLQLEQAITQSSADNTSALTSAYQRFNNTWVSSERVVRNTSQGHYGAIETAMALMRVAIETQPVALEKVRLQSSLLKQAIDDYNAGQSITVAQDQLALSDGLQLLRDGLSAFESKNLPEGQVKLTRFIEIWPMIEGEVSTRAPDLYSQVESQIPVVLAHGESLAQQKQLQSLINELALINPQAQYSAIDAMLILLREGLEALLIVMALISALNVARQEAGKRWVYGGVLAGFLASLLAALALQRLFPVATAGSNREMIEGVVGVFTVLMMILVGAWLHSKSSLQAWNLYLKRHMGHALTTGSLLSLFGLSFLSVFREGAETILFYAGILPRISSGDFLTGIGMAAAILAIIAVVLFRTSYKLPIAHMFKLLTWVIYVLGFKILGVSLHALQLTGHLRMTSLQVAGLESSALGLYPTLETLAAQTVYIAVIVSIQIVVSQDMKKIRSISLNEAKALQRPAL